MPAKEQQVCRHRKKQRKAEGIHPFVADIADYRPEQDEEKGICHIEHEPVKKSIGKGKIFFEGNGAKEQVFEVREDIGKVELPVFGLRKFGKVVVTEFQYGIEACSVIPHVSRCHRHGDEKGFPLFERCFKEADPLFAVLKVTIQKQGEEHKCAEGSAAHRQSDERIGEDAAPKHGGIKRPKKQQHVDGLRHEPYAAIGAHPHHVAAEGQKQRTEGAMGILHARAAQAAESEGGRCHRDRSNDQVVGGVFTENEGKGQHHHGGEGREGDEVFPLIHRKLQPWIALPEGQASPAPSHGLQGIAVPCGMGEQRAAEKVVQEHVGKRHQRQHAQKCSGAGMLLIRLVQPVLFHRGIIQQKQPRRNIRHGWRGKCRHRRHPFRAAGNPSSR